MSLAAWATLIVVGAFIWGGAVTLVTIAMRKEGRKRRAESETAGT